MTPADRSRILIVLHQEHSTPGRVGLRLVERGYQLDIRRPRFGDPLPDSLVDHAGAVIFGGPMSANDPDDYIKRETDWIEVPLKEGAPFLGLCLGAQLMARHLGAAVTANADGSVEVGYYPIWPTEAGRRLMDWPDQVHHFHREGFDLPDEAVLLATGEKFRNQAFSFGKSAFAIQFHIELTNAMVGRWTLRSSERAPQPGAQGAAEHFLGRALHDWKTKNFLEGFLDHWLASDPRPARG
ncbi:MAG: glutamine amidotransferase [Bauldia sp.]|uniref:glutamine amidotransferase n=1 Tax=Bauldia sp. TaxID=2575872 RepID=UPI001DE524FB|nr:glutamine amidotransferase [Bauldia sp.]MCB1497735.1 glutamine amidotransferase [Bauldia sp.]